MGSGVRPRRGSCRARVMRLSPGRISDGRRPPGEASRYETFPIRPRPPPRREHTGVLPNGNNPTKLLSDLSPTTMPSLGSRRIRTAGKSDDAPLLSTQAHPCQSKSDDTAEDSRPHSLPPRRERGREDPSCICAFAIFSLEKGPHPSQFAKDGGRFHIETFLQECRPSTRY